MTRTKKGVVGALVALVLGGIFWGSCAKGPEDGTTKGALQGQVVLGQNYLGTVILYNLQADGGVANESKRMVTVDGGSFSFDLPSYGKGPILLVASGGNYVDLTSSTFVSLSEGAASGATYLLYYEPGAVYSNIAITPFSTLHAAVTRKIASRNNVDLRTAAATATDRFRLLFQGVNMMSLPYRDLTSSTTTSDSFEATLRGLFLAGFSTMARDAADKAGRPTNSTVDVTALANLLSRDYETNAIFDGLTVSGDGTTRLYFPTDIVEKATKGTALDGMTLRRSLALGATKFLSSPRNATSVQSGTFPQVNAIANAKDLVLFGDGVSPGDGGSDTDAGDGDGGNPGGPVIDVVPPVVNWIAPQADAGVGGNHVEVTVEATDELFLKSLKFTKPENISEFVATKAEFDSSNRKATLRGILDVSGLQNGPLILEATADDGTNKTVKAINVVVSNYAPTLAMTVPTQGSTGSTTPIVKGIAPIRVEAKFTAPASRITKFTLLNPPPGMGNNISSDTKVFEASWDTTRALEGKVSLNFEAVDDLNQKGSGSFVLEVSNYEFAKIQATVTLGGPIIGAYVEAVALNPQTGERAQGGADSGIPVGGRLGLSTTTTNDAGFVEFTLSVKNYDGPIGLWTDNGNGSAKYMDPYDGGTLIVLGSNDILTTSFASYKTNDSNAASRDLKVPVNGWTTLADSAAKGSATPTASYVSNLGAYNDAVRGHFAASGNRWDPRRTFPANLLAPGSLADDVRLATVADYMFPGLARAIGDKTKKSPTAAYSALNVLQDLRNDILSPVFDGRGGGIQIKVLRAATADGSIDYDYSANTTRNLAAIALYNLLKQPWMVAGISVDSMSGIYENMSADKNPFLYPGNEPTLPWNPEPSQPLMSPALGSTYIPDTNLSISEDGKSVTNNNQPVVFGNGATIKKLSSTMESSPIKLRVSYPRSSSNSAVRSVVARLVKVNGSPPSSTLPGSVKNIAATSIQGLANEQLYEVALPKGTPFGTLEYEFEATSEYGGTSKSAEHYTLTLERAIPPLAFINSTSSDSVDNGLWNIKLDGSYGKSILGGEIYLAKVEIWNPTGEPASASILLQKAGGFGQMVETWVEQTDTLKARGLGAAIPAGCDLSKGSCNGCDPVDGCGDAGDAVIDGTGDGKDGGLNTQKYWYGGYLWQADAITGRDPEQSGNAGPYFLYNCSQYNSPKFQNDKRDGPGGAHITPGIRTKLATSPFGPYSDGKCHEATTTIPPVKVLCRLHKSFEYGVPYQAWPANSDNYGFYNTPIHYYGEDESKNRIKNSDYIDDDLGLSCEPPNLHQPGSDNASAGQYATKPVNINIGLAYIRVYANGVEIPFVNGSYAIPGSTTAGVPAATAYIVAKVIRPSSTQKLYEVPPLTAQYGSQKVRVGWAYRWLPVSLSTTIIGWSFGPYDNEGTYPVFARKLYRYDIYRNISSISISGNNFTFTPFYGVAGTYPTTQSNTLQIISRDEIK